MPHEQRSREEGFHRIRAQSQACVARAGENRRKLSVQNRLLTGAGHDGTLKRNSRLRADTGVLEQPRRSQQWWQPHLIRTSTITVGALRQHSEREAPRGSVVPRLKYLVYHRGHGSGAPFFHPDGAKACLRPMLLGKRMQIFCTLPRLSDEQQVLPEFQM